MSDYNDGKWHGWNGGECPVNLESIVNGIEPSGVHWECAAGDCDWFSFKGAFRVVKEHREPREFWVVDACAFGSRAEAAEHRSLFQNTGPIVHVREVIEE